jgi:hypothetical protein
MWGEGVGWDGQGGVVVSSLERVGDLVKEGRIVQVVMRDGALAS